MKAHLMRSYVGMGANLAMYDELAVLLSQFYQRKTVAGQSMIRNNDAKHLAAFYIMRAKMMQQPERLGPRLPVLRLSAHQHMVHNHRPATSLGPD